MRRRIGCAVVVGLLTVVHPVTSASATPSGWTAAVVPQPGHPTYQYQVPADISCVGVGTCVSVGSWQSPDGVNAYIATVADGQVVSSVSPPLPQDALAPPESPDAALTSVSCWAPGACVAVGSYWSTDNKRYGMIETLRDGAWHARTSPARTGDLYSSLDEVACSSVRCVATARDIAPDVVAWSAATGWQVETVTGVGVRGHLEPRHPTCVVDGACYLTVAADPNSVSERELFGYPAGSSWHAVYLPVPADGRPTSMTLSRLSCPDAGHCVALGSYQVKGKYLFLPIAETFADGVLAVATLPTPRGFSRDHDISDVDVACATSRRCVGFVSAIGPTLLYRLDGAQWTYQPAQSFFFPGQAACSAAGACLVAGGKDVARPTVYLDTSGGWQQQALLLPVTHPQSMTGYLTNASCAGTTCVGTGPASNAKHRTTRAIVETGTEVSTS